MTGREDEPGADATAEATSTAPGTPGTTSVAGTTTGAAAGGPAPATASGGGAEEDLAAETTHQVDTAGAARGDVRRPDSADPRWSSSPSAPSEQAGSTPPAADASRNGAARPGDAAASPASSPEVAAVAPPGPPAMSDLSSAQLLRPARPVPRTGWRRAVYVASGGVVNP